MARPLRLEYPGAVYHVMARGHERSPIYQDDEDRERFFGDLARVIEEMRFVVQGMVEHQNANTADTIFVTVRGKAC